MLRLPLQHPAPNILLKVFECCHRRKLGTSETGKGLCNKAAIPHLLRSRRAMFERDNMDGLLHFMSGCSGHMNSSFSDFFKGFFNSIAMLQILTVLYTSTEPCKYKH